MAKIKDLPLPEAQPKKSKKQVPEFKVSGDIVTRYNEACDQSVRAQLVMEELAPELKDLGRDFVFRHNCQKADDTKAQISSVNLVDDEGEQCQFTWKRANKVCVPALVEAFFKKVFTRTGKLANVNFYASWKPKAQFDADVFMVDGKFDQERYDAFLDALKDTAAKLQVANPLTCTKVFGPTGNFHELRFRDFTPTQNVDMAEVLPTTEALEPVRPEKDDEPSA